MLNADPETAASGSGRIGFAAWYALAVLTLVYTLHSVDRSVMSVVIEPVKAEFHLSDSQIGMLTGLAYGLTYSLASLPLGYLIDRVERRRLLAALVAIWSGFTALCGVAQSYNSLLLARMAVGVAEAGGAPTSISMISDIFPRRTRTMAISIYWVSTALGTAASFIVGSVIAVHHGWRAAFLIAGLPGLLLAAILYLTIKEPVRERSTLVPGNSEAPPTVRETLGFALRNRLFVHNFMGMTLNSMMLSGVLVWQASFLIRVHHLPLAKAGLMTGIAVGIFGSVGSFSGGPLGDRLFKRGGIAGLPLASLITSIVAVAIGLTLAFSGSMMVAVAALMAFELFARSYTGPSYSTSVGALPPRMRGLCVSAIQIATNLIGYGCGPYLAGVVSDHLGGPGGIRGGMALLMALGAWGALHFFLARRAGLRAATSFSGA